MERGKYIVGEGLDGTGKGVQTSIIIDRLGSLGINCVLVAEPGETEAGKIIRNIVKNENYKLDGYANALLFTANRRDNWVKKIVPCLNSGIWVISDRNWLSTVVYQVYGQQVSNVETIRNLTSQFVHEDYVKPDLTFILSLEEDVRAKRLVNRGDVQEAPDAFESKAQDFQNRLRLGYRAVAEMIEAPIINANGTPEEVHERIWPHIESLINEN